MERNNEISSSISQPLQSPGPFLAKVVSHLDPSYMGGLEVEILRPVGNNSTPGQVIPVKYMSPFYGVTSVEHNKPENEHNNTQKSYGMWMIPPDPGTTVVVIFIDGDAKRAYWIGCVQDDNMNFMVPGLAATSFNEAGSTVRQPVSEYNKKNSENNEIQSDTTKTKKPVHPFSQILVSSGLDKDDTRGITTSSARRETPSAVFGISTPGPLDKGNGAPQGKVGKQGQEANVYVSRLGGSTFVMDDGDDKFVREKPASAAAPKYIAIEQGESATDLSIPHNELVRIRTRTGHQILLHNSEDLIYISHGSGNSWIEMTANGKIDVYAKDSISFHTDNDFNFSAGRDINFKAGGEVNTVSAGMIKNSAGGNFEIKAANTNIDGGQIHLNSGKAGNANSPVRIPGKEPWDQHENLDPTLFTADKTKGAYKPAAATPPEMFKKYTTSTDTFAKIKGAEK